MTAPSALPSDGAWAGPVVGSVIFEVGGWIFVTATVKFPELVDAIPAATAAVRAVLVTFARTSWMFAALPAPLLGEFAGTVMVYCTSTEPVVWSNLGKCDWSRRNTFKVAWTHPAGTATKVATALSTPSVTFGSLTNAVALFTSRVKPPFTTVTTPAVGTTAVVAAMAKAVDVVTVVIFDVIDVAVVFEVVEVVWVEVGMTVVIFDVVDVAVVFEVVEIVWVEVGRHAGLDPDRVRSLPQERAVTLPM